LFAVVANGGTKVGKSAKQASGKAYYFRLRQLVASFSSGKGFSTRLNQVIMKFF
jgi:hypothetical protein